MTKPAFTAKEVEVSVRSWTKGGCYVSVPSAWAGKRVKVVLLEQS